MKPCMIRGNAGFQPNQAVRAQDVCLAMLGQCTPDNTIETLSGRFCGIASNGRIGANPLKYRCPNRLDSWIITACRTILGRAMSEYDDYYQYGYNDNGDYNDIDGFTDDYGHNMYHKNYGNSGIKIFGEMLLIDVVLMIGCIGLCFCVVIAFGTLYFWSKKQQI